MKVLQIVSAATASCTRNELGRLSLRPEKVARCLCIAEPWLLKTQKAVRARIEETATREETASALKAPIRTIMSADWPIAMAFFYLFVNL